MRRPHISLSDSLDLSPRHAPNVELIAAPAHVPVPAAPRQCLPRTLVSAPPSMRGAAKPGARGKRNMRGGPAAAAAIVAARHRHRQACGRRHADGGQEGGVAWQRCPASPPPLRGPPTAPLASPATTAKCPPSARCADPRSPPCAPRLHRAMRAAGEAPHKAGDGGADAKTGVRHGMRRLRGARRQPPPPRPPPPPPAKSRLSWACRASRQRL